MEPSGLWDKWLRQQWLRQKRQRETRLIETNRSGLERDLLRSAFSDVAPDAVRARVQQTVARVLQSSLPQQRAHQPETAAPSAAAARKPVSRRLLLALGSPAVYWGVGLAAATAAVPLLQRELVSSRERGTEAGLRGQLSARSASSPPLPPGPFTPELPAPELQPQESSRGHEGEALANTNTAPLPEIEATPAAPAKVRGSTRKESGLQESAPQQSTLDQNTLPEPDDWLGAQFQLLAEAREHLASGRWEQAGELLDDYEQLFPGGVIRPQVGRLRDDLRDRRVLSAAPSR